MKTKYSVAVRPTPEEVKRNGYYYDEAYYEDRAEIISAESESEAIAEFIQRDQALEDRKSMGIKKGEQLTLQQAEIPYIRTRKV